MLSCTAPTHAPALGDKALDDEALWCDGPAAIQMLNEIAEVHVIRTDADLGLHAIAGVGAAAAAGRGISKMRQGYGAFLAANLEEIIEEAARLGQVQWSRDWATQAQGARAAEAQLEREAVERWAQTHVIEGWTDHPHTPRFPPRLKFEVGGDWIGAGAADDTARVTRIVDIANIADVDITRLPDKFHGDNVRSARVAVEMLRDATLAGRAPDRHAIGARIHGVWLEFNTWAAEHPIMGQSYAQMRALAAAGNQEAADLVHLDLSRISTAEQAVRRVAAKRSLLAMGATAVAELIARRGMGRALQILSGVGTIAGIALTINDVRDVLGILVDTFFEWDIEIGGVKLVGTEDCFREDAPNTVYVDSESRVRLRDVTNLWFESSFVETDSNACTDPQFEYVIDERVRRMLVESDEVRLDYLSHPDVCRFYQELHRKTVPRQPTISSAQCTESGDAMLTLARPRDDTIGYLAGLVGLELSDEISVRIERSQAHGAGPTIFEFWPARWQLDREAGTLSLVHDGLVGSRENLYNSHPPISLSDEGLESAAWLQEFYASYYDPLRSQWPSLAPFATCCAASDECAL